MNRALMCFSYVGFLLSDSLMKWSTWRAELTPNGSSPLANTQGRKLQGDL